MNCKKDFYLIYFYYLSLNLNIILNKIKILQFL